MQQDPARERKEYLAAEAAKNRDDMKRILSKWAIEHGTIEWPIEKDGSVKLLNLFDLVLAHAPLEQTLQDMRADGFHAEVRRKRRFLFGSYAVLEVGVKS